MIMRKLRILCCGGLSLVLPACHSTAESTRPGTDPWAQVPVILKRIVPPTFPTRDFEVTRYGAVADGDTDCTAAFRKAVTVCAEAGGGRLLNPDAPADNPFLHDRRKTYQPRDLWWWLLLVAVALFPLDVGLRRIQLEREELARAWARLVGMVGLRRRPAAVAPQESMATLLARKEQVRATHAGAPGAAGTTAGPATPDGPPSQSTPTEPSPDLFRPAKEVAPTEPASEPSGEAGGKPGEPGGAGSRTGAGEGAGGGAESATSRLLEAKRRARKKL